MFEIKKYVGKRLEFEIVVDEAQVPNVIRNLIKGFPEKARIQVKKV